MYTVNQIEDALVVGLKADEALSAYVKSFQVLPSTTEADLEKLFAQFPAIGVMGTEGDFDYATSGIAQTRGAFIVLCCNRNLRSPVAALRGGADGEKGCWDMIEDARLALTGNDLGLNIIDCLPRRRLLLFAGEKGAACSLEVDVTWR